jgi:epoxide hydrolase-like predicted phosphatase
MSDAREPVEAVLLDFGGVFTPSPFEAVGSYARARGVDPERFLTLTFGPYDEDTDHPWHRLERGEVALRDAREAILALGRAAGIEVDLFSVLRAMAEGPRPALRAPVVERVRGLRQRGLRTALVTNNAAEFAGAWRPLLPLHELFDAVLDSSELGVRKPDPRIYRRALAQLGGVAPARAVFLDDYPGNVEAARRLGLHGLIVGDPFEDAFRELDALLGP